MRFAKIKNYDDITKLKTDKIQDLLENWVMYLQDRGLKSITIKTKLGAVELFLEMNKITFHKRVLHKLIPPPDYIPGGQQPFTTEEIQQMLAATTKLRTKALIHYFASTGTRPASIADPILKIKHIEDVSHDCKSVWIYDGSKEGYWGFLTPEATKALNNYLNSRKLNGEELGLESPVFANVENPGPTKKVKHLSAKSVRQIIYKLFKQAGIERTKNGNRYDKAPVYGFRKRFNTTLKINNQVNSNIAEKLMAHKRGLDGVYFKPTREQCFAEFQKAILELIIDPTERQGILIKKQKQEITELESQKNRIDDLENSFRKLSEMVLDTAADDDTREIIKEMIDETYNLHNIGDWKKELLNN